MCYWIVRSYSCRLHAALLTRAAAIVRDRRDILDGADFQSDGLQGANGRFTARTRTLDAHFDFAHAVRHGLACSVLSDLLSGERSALARTLEAHTAGAGPTDHVTLHVGD